MRAGLPAAALVAGLLLAGCSGVGGSSGAGPTSAGAASSTDASAVSCSAGSCSLRLSPGSTVDVLGTRVSLGGVEDGRASLGVGDRSVSCTQGQSVSAGPLRLTCTTVTADRVVLSAGLGG